MFINPTPNKCKILRISLLIVFTVQLILGLYVAFQFFKISQFTIWFLAAGSFYLWLINHIVTISGCRLEDNMLIIKKVANKTDLMPLEKTIIDPLYIGQELVIIKVKYHIDGIRRSALILTNSAMFGKIKKGKL